MILSLTDETQSHSRIPDRLLSEVQN
ncbi:Protein of unknown function [Propionibacterium freudenreichii]|nr:Protein of unknown function [Propionibacterium freudenreichii]